MKSVIKKLFSFLVKEPDAQVLSGEIEKSVSKADMLSMAHSVRQHLLENCEGITVSISDETGRHQLTVHGSINAKIDLIFKIKTVDIRHVDVELAMREQGHCRRFIQHLHNAVREIGFQKMSLKAVRDGRVAWAALGFRPTIAAWKLRKASFANAYYRVRHLYSEDVTRLLERLISENDRDSFPVLANVKYTEQDRDKYKEISKGVMDDIKDWDGEFIIEDKEYTQYLFR